ncbi:uncharacterized protein LOC132029930 [Lycium ferocissimum]|uniref:uncharacterized protein LOC132029930 n=1 Tax=Lycium ferocissimum TaxID=112874 RepID=UPI0028160A90|nr:uncharacterized protein LOC132029930 [Lycium ferocissimum]
MRLPLPRCTRCGKLYSGPCRLGLNVCYACARPSHFRCDCPWICSRDKVRPIGLAAGSSSSIHASRKRPQVLTGCDRDRGGTPSPSGSQHHTYALAGRQDLESLCDIVPEFQVGYTSVSHG